MKEILRTIDSNVIKVEPCDKSSTSLNFTPANSRLQSTIPTISSPLPLGERSNNGQNVDTSQRKEGKSKTFSDLVSTDSTPISAKETQGKGPSGMLSPLTAIPAEMLSLKSEVEKLTATEASPSKPGSDRYAKQVADSSSEASSSDDSSTDDSSSESEDEVPEVTIKAVTPVTQRPIRKIFTAEFKAANSYQAHKKIKSSLSGKIAGFITTQSKPRKRQIVITPMPVPKNLPIGGSRQHVDLYDSKPVTRKVIASAMAPKPQTRTPTPLTRSSSSPLKQLAERLSSASEKTPSTLIINPPSNEEEKIRSQEIEESKDSSFADTSKHGIASQLELKKLIPNSHSDLPAVKRRFENVGNIHNYDDETISSSDIHQTKRHCGLRSENTNIDDNSENRPQKDGLQIVDAISKSQTNSLAKPSPQLLSDQTSSTLSPYDYVISNLSASNPTTSQALIRSLLDLFNETAIAKTLQATRRVENMERIDQFEFQGFRELEDLEVAFERRLEDSKLRVERKFEDYKLEKARKLNRFKLSTMNEESLFGLELEEQFKNAIRSYQTQEQMLSC